MVDTTAGAAAAKAAQAAVSAAGGSPAGGDWASQLEGPQRDAFAALSGLFASYGLSSLAPKIFEYIKNGYSADTISLLLQDTPEYKQRFAANDQRRKAGLTVLTPAQYLATEAAYRQVLQASGLPVGFYDSPADFTQWLASDVSPTEIKERADAAIRVVQGTPELRSAVKQLYGVSEGDVAAYFLDQQRATPILETRLRAAEIAAQGLARGFAVSQNAERFAQQGITAQQAAQGYAEIADTFGALQGLAQIYGTHWTQGESELAVFEPGTLGGQESQQPGAESPAQKQRRLASQERAMFAQTRGVNSSSLGSGGF